MIEDVIHLLQRISCIWLALSVIYPAVNNRITAAAQRNNPVDYDRSSKHAPRSKHLFYPACTALALVTIDLLISVL